MSAACFVASDQTGRRSVSGNTGNPGKTYQKLTVTDHVMLSPGVYSIVLAYPEGKGPTQIRPGQFVGVYCHDSARLLPRPISICDWTYAREVHAEEACAREVHAEEACARKAHTEGTCAGEGYAEECAKEKYIKDTCAGEAYVKHTYAEEKCADQALAGSTHTAKSDGGLHAGDLHMEAPGPAATARLRLVYRVVGQGTRELSTLQEGDTVTILGLLGNGYDLSILTGKRVLLIGGGIGAPPLLGLAKAIWKENHKGSEAAAGAKSGANEAAYTRKENYKDSMAVSAAISSPMITAVLGYRTDQLFLKEDFAPYADVMIATDDGSAGTHGTVIDAIRQYMQDTKTNDACCFPWDVICACGPLPMLRGVKQLAEEMQVPCYLSMEERMACGVGACLGCVTRTTKRDAHSGVYNTRICTEGPVFNAEDVVL